MYNCVVRVGCGECMVGFESVLPKYAQEDLKKGTKEELMTQWNFRIDDKNVGVEQKSLFDP